MSYNYKADQQPPKHEQKLAISSLTATGTLPYDKWWNHERTLHDARPIQFDHHHVTLGMLLDRDYAQRKGLLGINAPLFRPGSFLSLIQYRHGLLPLNFDHYHPFLGSLLEIHLPDIEPSPPLTPPVPILPGIPVSPLEPPVISGGSVPEPPSLALCSIALLIGGLWTVFNGRKKVIS